MIRRLLKKSVRPLLGLSLGILVFIGFCNSLVRFSATGKVYDSTSDLPVHDVALVLGTNPIVQGRFQNPYFNNRIKAAAELYQAGKVKHFILSGDNSLKSYNEPLAMQEALEKYGVPASATTLDYAGFRTLDSVVRCREVFQQQRITIISQKFHNERALFIANNNHLDAIAYNATDPFGQVMNKTYFREYFARCKAVLDIYILNKKPKYLGKKIELLI